jgi:electron transfer flavoprotein alpha subunit
VTARIFAYIAHRNGMADDSAAELLAAAKKIDPAAKPTAIVIGSGAELDRVCAALCASYNEVWKVASDPLAYPNAELIRNALVKVVPQGSIVMVPHNHFGIDLAPGLSVKLNAAFVSDVMGIDGSRARS